MRAAMAAKAPETETAERRDGLDVLVIDDEKNIRATIAVCLEGMGCRVTGVANAEAARAALADRAFDMAFLDLRLNDVSGLDLLPDLLARRPSLAVVIITAYATIETAVAAIRRGAADYLPKPFTPDQIRHVVKQLVERQRMVRRVADLEQQLKDAIPDIDLDTTAPAMRAALDMIPPVAASDATVLLRGENGTGKGVLARLLHARSARHERPFVVVNCPTLSGELLASELFGHARGAFTDAVRDQPGRVEAADGGTLFLDEIGEISPALQAKLLRFLQDRQFERIGENTTRAADVRIIAATNRDLEAAVARGTFREDLFYRLNVFPIRLPPLRERAEDIPILVEYLVDRFAKQTGKRIRNIEKSTLQRLQAYDWPGNVRELQNVIERAVVLSEGETFAIDESWLARKQSKPPHVAPVTTLADGERALIEAALTESQGRVAGPRGAAAKLDIPRQTLEWKIRTLNIDKLAFRKR
jgi:two-component system, NtrC family, response regulator AlgB